MYWYYLSGNGSTDVISGWSDVGVKLVYVVSRKR